jgi:transposase InsO family protein
LPRSALRDRPRLESATKRHKRLKTGRPAPNFGRDRPQEAQRKSEIRLVGIEHPIRSMCEALEVSASGYYDWSNRQAKPGPRAQENARLLQKIVQIHQDSRQTYGSPRIQKVLSNAGCAHGRHRIARLMRQQGLCGRAKGRFRVRTTDSHHDQPIAPNRLPQLPAPRAPNQIWRGDLTSIATEEGWLYLAGILDQYSRRLIGWAMSEHIDTKLILAAWDMALTHRQSQSGGAAFVRFLRQQHQSSTIAARSAGHHRPGKSGDHEIARAPDPRDQRQIL